MLLKRLCLGIFAICALLGATRGTQDAVANGDTRTLEIKQMHTKEHVRVTFRRNGRYDQRGLEQLNWIMRDWRRDEATKMNPRLFDVLWEVHRSSGSRGPVHVVSAYRAPQTNAMLRRRSSGVAQTSQHIRGNAVDFYLPDVPADRIRAIGMRMQRGGVGYYPRANTPFIHLDVGSVRHWPRMTRQQLVRMFPDERTAHLPADGKPLAGFEQARREILAAGGTVMGETGTATAEAGTGRRSLWAALFGGGGEESNEDLAEVNSMASDGWIAPGSAPPSTAVASLSSPPAPVASTPPAPAPATALVPAQIVPPLGITSSPGATTDAVAINAEVPLPVSRPRDLGIQTAAASIVEQPVEDRPLEPELVWRQGPAGQPITGSGEAEGRQVVAELPLPPRRPAPDESIGSLVTAFASTSSSGSSDALAQLGITPPVGLRGGVTPPERSSRAPGILPPRRQIPAATSVVPVIEAATDAPAVTVASLAPPAPAAPEAVATAMQSRATASVASRAPALNVIAIARDEGAALRSLFVDRASNAVSPVSPARIAVARVRRDQSAPAGFVAVSGSGLAQGFSKEPRVTISTNAFDGPAVAPLQLRR